MRMYTIAANNMRELEAEANKRGIQKDQIVQILQTSDGLFTLTYYAQE